MTFEEKVRRKLCEKYTVVETPCYPDSFKVVGINWVNHGDNHNSNYFPTLKQALEEASKRNNNIIFH